MKTVVVISSSHKSGSSSISPLQPIHPPVSGGVPTPFLAVNHLSTLPTNSIPSHVPSQISSHTLESLRTVSKESTPPPDHEAQNADESADSAGPVSKGLKTGMIVGIVVVVVLTLIVLGFCVFDCRRRFRRRKDNVPDRASDVNIWETQIRNGRGGQRNSIRLGLWDKLKVGDNRGRQPGQQGDSLPRIDEHRPTSISKHDNVEDAENNNIEGVGPHDIPKSKKGGRVESSRYEREPEWLPAYVPRERASIVSSVGSMSTPLVSIPVISRVALEEESRLSRHK